MYKGKNVFVGLSGGVDSATSAGLLLKGGYDVTGVFINITVDGYPCMAGQDRLDAMRAAAHLRIPFIEIDLSGEYQERVFKESLKEFERGSTPNPDALCNREIKFGLFYEWARAQGADFIATGHYARVASKNPPKRRDRHDPNSVSGDFVELLTGIDPNKDQSYFLWAVPQDVLAHVLFPVGYLTKPQVRKLADKFGLPNAKRKDSQGLCFLGPISVSDMLKRELHPVPGAVLDEAGETVGKHDGAILYTMGQRHGFALTEQGPSSSPHYVIAKNLKENTITVSKNKFPAAAGKTKLVLSETNWIGDVESGSCLVRYRYHQQLIPAVLEKTSLNKDYKGRSFVEVTLLQPHYAPLGQSLVMYRQDRCLGGGVIQASTLV